jgi:hypothetical protein
MEKTLSYVRKFLRYEKPSDEEVAALWSYVRAQAGKRIKNRSKEDLDDLPAKFISEGLREWRRKHLRFLLKLDDEELLKRFCGAVRGFLFEERGKIIKEAKGPVCDAGQISGFESEEGKEDPEDGDEGPKEDKDSLLGLLRPLPSQDLLEQMAKIRDIFHRTLDTHLPAGEWLEREGTPCARLLSRVLRQVSNGDRTPEAAFELLSVVFEMNELKFKERAKRVALFLSVLEEYEKPETYTSSSPVTMYPSCGLSEAPTVEFPLSEKALEKAKTRLELKQGALAGIFSIDPTSVSAMKKRRSNGVDAALESERMLEEAEKIVEERKAAILEKFEDYLKDRFGI